MDQSRSRAPPERRRSARRPCAARCAFRRLGVRAGQTPPPRGTSNRFPFTPVAWEREPVTWERVPRRTAAVRPAVRRRSHAHASQGWLPYCGVNAGSLLRGEEKETPCYKGCSRPFLGHACRCPPLEVAWRAPPSEPHRHLYNLPWPPYCTPRAPQVACVPGRASCSPEDQSQRPPEAGAAEPPRRHASEPSNPRNRS
jgi:hypothetical protein